MYITQSPSPNKSNKLACHGTSSLELHRPSPILSFNGNNYPVTDWCWKLLPRLKQFSHHNYHHNNYHHNLVIIWYSACELSTLQVQLLYRWTKDHKTWGAFCIVHVVAMQHLEWSEKLCALQGQLSCCKSHTVVNTPRPLKFCISQRCWLNNESFLWPQYQGPR